MFYFCFNDFAFFSFNIVHSGLVLRGTTGHPRSVPHEPVTLQLVTKD